MNPMIKTSYALINQINLYQRNMSRVTNEMIKGNQQPSYILKINRFESAFRGANVAQKNIQDGISMIQHAQSAISSMQNIGIKLYELSVQYNNDTLTKEDRKNIEKEAKLYLHELKHLAENTTFNGKKLFNSDKVTIQTGANTADKFTFTLPKYKKVRLDSSTSSSQKVESSSHDSKNILSQKNNVSQQQSEQFSSESNMQNQQMNINLDNLLNRSTSSYDHLRNLDSRIEALGGKEGLLGLIGGIFDGVKDIVEGVGDIVDDAGELVGGIIDEVEDFLNDLGNLIGNLIGGNSNSDGDQVGNNEPSTGDDLINNPPVSDEDPVDEKPPVNKEEPINEHPPIDDENLDDNTPPTNSEKPNEVSPIIDRINGRIGNEILDFSDIRISELLNPDIIQKGLLDPLSKANSSLQSSQYILENRLDHQANLEALNGQNWERIKSADIAKKAMERLNHQMLLDVSTVLLHKELDNRRGHILSLLQ